MKKWNKPSMKVVVLDGADLVTASQDDVTGVSSNTSSVIVNDKSNSIWNDN